jgi:hypothetical protein
MVITMVALLAGVAYFYDKIAESRGGGGNSDRRAEKGDRGEARQLLVKIGEMVSACLCERVRARTSERATALELTTARITLAPRRKGRSSNWPTRMRSSRKQRLSCSCARKSCEFATAT